MDYLCYGLQKTEIIRERKTNMTSRCKREKDRSHGKRKTNCHLDEKRLRE